MAAFIAVTFYAAELIGAPIFGAMSDRYGRKLFMVLGPLFGGVAIQILGFTAIIPVLALVRILEGLSTASSAPSTLGFISAETATSVRLRGRVMGFYEAATVVGLASGAAIAGQLYDRFGTASFTMIAGIYLAALLLFLPVRDRARHVASAAGHPGFGTLRRVLNRRILRFAPAWLAANAVLGGWLNVGPFLAAGAPDPGQFLMQGAEAGHIGVVFMVFGVLFTAGAVSWGYIMPSIGRQATLLWGVGGLGLVSVCLWLLNQQPRDDSVLLLPTLVALIAIGVFIEAGFTPAALAYLAEIAEENARDRGAVMGLYSVLLSVGQLLGTGLAGPFATAWGFHGLILLTGLLTVVAGFTVVLLGYSERREAFVRAQQTAH
jgi:MFS family permease